MTVRFAPALAALLAGLATPTLAQDGEPEPSVTEPASIAEGVTGAAAPSSGDTPAPAIQRAIPASPFSLEQRNGWLAQCRIVFLQRGAALGGDNGLPDACETQLAQYESSYVAPADGSSQAPVIMVRVPITPAPTDPDLDLADTDAAEPAEGDAEPQE